MKLKLAILTLGMFAIGTDGYVIAGLLPEIAAHTGATISQAGQLITIFALVYAAASPVLASAFGRADRKSLLMGALAVFTLGNIVAALAGQFWGLALGRVIAALGAAAFTPAALAITGFLVAPQLRGRSIALVTSGLTVSTVIGVPLGNWIGANFGYHGVFWLIAALSALVLTAVVMAFDSVPAPQAVRLIERLAVATRQGAPATLVVSLLIFTGVFAVYTYIAAYFAARTGLTGAALSWVLLAFGVGGIIGNLVGGVLSDRIGTRNTVMLSAIMVSIAFTGLWLLGQHTGVAIVFTVAWGVSGWLLAPAQQHRLLEVGGPAAPLLISLNSSAMYLGMAASGVLGALILNTAGVEQLPLAGLATALVSLVIVITAYPAHHPSAQH